MLTFTFKEGREYDACGTSYRKFAKFKGGITKWGANKPFPILEVLESNGLDDTLWVLGHCKATDERDRIIRLFSCDCAERALPIFEKEYPKDKRPRKAIEVSRQFTNGKATQKQLDAAWDTAWDAAWDTTRDATRDVTRAARDAAWDTTRDATRDAAWAATWDATRDAAWAATWDAEKKWQAERLRHYLNLKG